MAPIPLPGNRSGPDMKQKPTHTRPMETEGSPKQSMEQAAQAIDVREQLTQLQLQVSNASEHIINLIVIFVLQTILLPIGFVWLFMECLKGIAQRLAGGR